MVRFDEPSSINQVKDHRLTKRRLVKILSSAGFGAASVSALTVDDVKAADSDQVTIALTCDGERTKRVSSDWYDAVVRARRVKETVENNWLSSGNGERDTHNDVFGVWLDAGTGANAPHVIVTIDEDSSTKAETRGSVPERRNDVRIAVEEAPREYESMCDPKCKSDTSEMPGGLEVCFDHGCGTLGPQAYDYNDNSWVLTTAAHIPADGGYCGEDIINEVVKHCGESIGLVKDVDHKHDMCIIMPYFNTDTLPEVWNPSDHSERWGTITDSLSADGVDYWMSNDRKVWKYGKRSCKTQGEVKARGTKENPLVNDPCTPGTWNDCVQWGHATDNQPGDSGSIAFGADPDSDDFYAICQNSWSWVNYATGPAGYAWKNHHGYEWRTF